MRLVVTKMECPCGKRWNAYHHHDSEYLECPMCHQLIPAPFYPESCSESIVLSVDDANVIAGGLDALAVALADHGHHWSEGERTIYEESIKLLNLAPRLNAPKATKRRRRVEPAIWVAASILGTFLLVFGFALWATHLDRK